MKGGPSQKFKPCYQEESSKDLAPMPGNKKVKDPSGPGAGKTHGGPSSKLALKIKTK
jgi:hypothetical protein